MDANDFETQEFWVVRVHTEDHRFVPANWDMNPDDVWIKHHQSRKDARLYAKGIREEDDVLTATPVKAILMSKQAYGRMLWAAKQYYRRDDRRWDDES